MMKQEPTRGPETPSIDALREELKRSRYRRSYAAAMRHTIVVLVLASIRRRREDQPPASLGTAYFREER